MYIMHDGVKITAFGTVFVLVLSLFFSSCSVEKKLGKEYRQNWSDSVVLVLMPDFIFKNNLKTYEIPGVDTLPQWQKDSILFANSIFLKQLQDSSIIAAFNKQFTNRLKEYHFNVIPANSLDSFMTMPQSRTLLNIAQISIEEFVHPYSFDYDLMDESMTIENIDLNAVSINVWLEVSPLNSNEKNKVLFVSDFILDELEGYFRQYVFTGQMQFEYTIDTLSLSGINTFINFMAASCADNLYDYYLNNYIQRNLPSNYPFEIRTLHWDPVQRVFEYIEPGKGFIELENAGQ